jgi:hypothetical protein
LKDKASRVELRIIQETSRAENTEAQGKRQRRQREDRLARDKPLPIPKQEAVENTKPKVRTHRRLVGQLQLPLANPNTRENRKPRKFLLHPLRNKQLVFQFDDGPEAIRGRLM